MSDCLTLHLHSDLPAETTITVLTETTECSAQTDRHSGVLPRWQRLRCQSRGARPDSRDGEVRAGGGARPAVLASLPPPAAVVQCWPCCHTQGVDTPLQWTGRSGGCRGPPLGAALQI